MFRVGFTGAINLASGATLTIRELVDTVQRVAGYQGTVEWDRTKPNGQEMRGYDISKLQTLGLSPAYGFEAGLRETYQWFEHHIQRLRR